MPKVVRQRVKVTVEYDFWLSTTSSWDIPVEAIKQVRDLGLEKADCVSVKVVETP